MPSLPYGDLPGRGHARRAADMRPSDSDSKRLHEPAGDEKRSEDREGPALAARRVWDICRDEATQSDERMLSGWNKTLDILLIFAGVFSAVATTFIVESNDQLRPDWNEYTARLLYVALSAQIGAGNAGAVLPAPSNFAAIPASSTSRWICGAADSGHCPTLAPRGEPPALSRPRALWTPCRRPIRYETLQTLDWPLRRILVFTEGVCSLAISLVVALFCILAKQWLIEYHARVSWSARSAQQWCRQRSLFFVGLEAWRMPLIIASLPALLHLSMFLFLVGMVLFFWALHRIVALCLLAITCCIAVLYIAAGLATFYDVACPYYISLFHQLHVLLGRLYARASSFPRFVAHVTEAGKLRLDAAALAWLSSTSPGQDVISASISAVMETFKSTSDHVLPDHLPDPTHMLQLLEALCAMDHNASGSDMRMDAALVILHHTLMGDTLDELMLRSLVDAISDLCLSYLGAVGSISKPATIGDARFDAISLRAHVAAEGTHYSLKRTELPAKAMSRIWAPELFDDPGPIEPGSRSLLRLSIESSIVVLPLSTFVASPAFLDAQWAELDISALSTILSQPSPNISIGGQAVLNLLTVATVGNAVLYSIFSVTECIRRNPAAGLHIVGASTDEPQPWYQLCCSLDSPAMSEGDKAILAPLLLECAAALGMEIWRQHTGTESATRLGRRLFDARCMAPILRAPALGAHGMELSRSSFVYRGRTTGMHSAEHLFINIMPAVLPVTWKETWDGIISWASANELGPEVRETLGAITLRLQQRGKAEVGQFQVTQQIVSRAISPQNPLY